MKDLKNPFSNISLPDLNDNVIGGNNPIKSPIADQIVNISHGNNAVIIGGTPKIEITAQILDEDGPLMGAHIVEVGNTSNGTTADFNGNFTLQVNAGSDILVGYMGKKDRVFNAQSTPVVINLSQDTNSLDPVVITADPKPKPASSINWWKYAKIGGATLLTATILYYAFKPLPKPKTITL